MKHLRLIVLGLLLSSSFFSCKNNNSNENGSGGLDDSLMVGDYIEPDSTYLKDVLTPVEEKYFKIFENEENVFISDSVIRYHKLVDGKMVNYLNEFLYQRDAADLIGGTFMLYTMTYTPFTARDASIFIDYSYSAGNASTGVGSIIKLGDKVVHTERGCDASCYTVVKINGKQVFRKNE